MKTKHEGKIYTGSKVYDIDSMDEKIKSKKQELRELKEEYAKRTN